MKAETACSGKIKKSDVRHKGGVPVEITQQGDVLSVKHSVEYGGFKSDVYMYLVDGMLVDTGAYRVLDDVIAFYKDHKDIELACITHSHEDHTGTAAWLAQNRQIPIYIHPMSIETCAKPGEYPLYRHGIWGQRDPFAALPLADQMDSCTKQWKVLHTPGHAADHMAFLNRATGILFSGDLLVTPKTKIILREESIPTIMSSIRKVLTYDFEEVFCCHRGYVKDGRQLFEIKLDYLENLSGEIIHLYEQGNTMDEIKCRLFPATPVLFELSDGEWDSGHIVRTVIEGHKAQMQV